MVTIQDIANHLGIAVSTVSKGLNNASDISDSTRQMVLDAAIELGYTPRKKRNLATPFEQKVCIIIENMDYMNKDTFTYDLVQGFQQHAFFSNWKVDIVPLSLNARSNYQYDAMLMTNHYSGAFWVGHSMHNDYSVQISKTRFPTVLFDNHFHNNKNIGYIGTDSYEGVKLALTHLYDLGHRKIAFLNSTKSPTVSHDRALAFERVMKELGIHIHSDLVENGYYVPDCAKYHVPKFIDNGATAIFCASDLIASGAISEVTKRGLRVPQDISIIGYDDLPFSSNLTPALTTIRQDRFNLGRCACILLNNLIQNIPISKYLLRPELVLRKSTCPPR